MRRYGSIHRKEQNTISEKIAQRRIKALSAACKFLISNIVNQEMQQESQQISNQPRDNSTLEKQAQRKMKFLLACKLLLSHLANKDMKQESQQLLKKPEFPDINYGILSQDDAKQWVIAQKDGIKKPQGTYAFVCTRRGVIRLSPAPNGNTNHLGLADYADRIRYAGVIHFTLNKSGQSVLRVLE